MRSRHPSPSLDSLGSATHTERPCRLARSSVRRLPSLSCGPSHGGPITLKPASAICLTRASSSSAAGGLHQNVSTKLEGPSRAAGGCPRGTQAERQSRPTSGARSERLLHAEVQVLANHLVGEHMHRERA